MKTAELKIENFAKNQGANVISHGILHSCVLNLNQVSTLEMAVFIVWIYIAFNYTVQLKFKNLAIRILSLSPVK
jgi:hypothetical protein